MSVAGSKHVPNDWTGRGAADLAGQAAWDQEMFRACSRRDWVRGFALWSWTDKLYDASDAGQRLDYELYAKPAEKIVQQNYAVIK